MPSILRLVAFRSVQLSESGLTGLATPAMHNIKSALMDQIRTYQQQLHDLKMRLGDREGELDTLRYGWWKPAALLAISSWDIQT